MNKEMKFAGGMTFKEVPETAPETVRGQIFFKADEFIAFLNANKNERGYVNVKMMKSMKTQGIYFILDEWKKPEGLLTDEEKQRIVTARDNHNSRNEDQSMEAMASEIPF